MTHYPIHNVNRALFYYHVTVSSTFCILYIGLRIVFKQFCLVLTPIIVPLKMVTGSSKKFISMKNC